MLLLWFKCDYGSLLCIFTHSVISFFSFFLCSFSLSHWKQTPSQTVHRLVWQVQSFFFLKKCVYAFYSNKELNHESDSQDQHPLHMSITRQMAVCMTIVQKPLSNCQKVTKQAIVTRKEYSWQLGSWYCHSLAIIHIWNWPVGQNGRTNFNGQYFSFLFLPSLFSLIISHWCFTETSPTCQFSLAIWPSTTTRKGHLACPKFSLHMTPREPLCPCTVEETKTRLQEGGEYAGMS